MREALKEARIALGRNDWPIGCVIVLDDLIIARAHSQSYSIKDRLAHAELLAMRECTNLLWDNKDKTTLYSTYKPCPESTCLRGLKRGLNFT